MKTKTQIIFFCISLLVSGLLLGGYFALVYIPSWYHPAYVDPVDQEGLRDNFTAITARFNEGMQHQKSFDFSISAQQINSFISGMEFFDPRLKDIVPSGVQDPAIQLENDYLKVGAVVRQDGKKAFASFWIKITPLGEWLVLDDLKVKIGLYPVPQSMLARQIETITGNVSQSFPIVKQMLEKGQYPNCFRYPNSDYDFRITHLRAADGVLYVTIEPLARQK
ncbi:MAG: hypothetical protein WC975_16665 [Phycisphaerae bacterium]